MRTDGGIEDVVVLTLHFEGGPMANLIVSWLDPRKVREVTVVGRKKMLVYDDVSANEKIRIYDKSVDGPKDYDSFGDFAYSYRYGDIVTPMLQESEPLRLVCSQFVESIRTGKPPRTSGEDGALVTRILVAAQWSLRHGGVRAAVADAPKLETPPVASAGSMVRGSSRSTGCDPAAPRTRSHTRIEPCLREVGAAQCTRTHAQPGGQGSDDEAMVWHVARDDRSGSYQCITTDRDPAQESCICADRAPPAQQCPLHVLVDTLLRGRRSSSAPRWARETRRPQP